MGKKCCKWIGASFFPPAQCWKSCAELRLLLAVAAFVRRSDKPLLRLMQYSIQVILIGLNAEAVQALVKLIYRGVSHLKQVPAIIMFFFLNAKSRTSLVT